MTAPDFTFNEKAGEIQRDGTVIPLNDTLCRVFAVLHRNRSMGKVPVYVLSEALGCSPKVAWQRVKRLRAKLEPIGLSIPSDGRELGGYQIVVGPMPKKWQPNIPPPVVLEGGDQP